MAVALIGGICAPLGTLSSFSFYFAECGQNTYPREIKFVHANYCDFLKHPTLTYVIMKSGDEEASSSGVSDTKHIKAVTENVDPYSSIEAYLAYLAQNIDPDLAKFRYKDQATAEQVAEARTDSDKDSQKSENLNVAKAAKNKNAVPVKTKEKEESSESSKDSDSTASKDTSSKGNRSKGKKGKEDKIYDEEECKKEIEHWFDKAKLWGDENEFPAVPVKELGTTGEIKTSED